MGDKHGFSTKAIHSDKIEAQWPGHPVVPPISLSSTFKQKSPGKPYYKYEYSRSNNPTRESLENSLAVLEKAKFALAYASGLAAETCILHLLGAHDEILCMDDVYGGTNRLFNKVFSSFGLISTMADLSNLETLPSLLTAKTRVVWVETPTNPTLKLVDIRAVRNVLDKEGENVLLVVDNTFATPYFQNPLELGADIVVHSLTKYINGHSDVVMGALMMNDAKLYRRLQFYQNALGSVPSPFDCYLVLRGIKTLAVRMERHQHNALRLATHCEGHSKIKRVLYPGLSSHPHHELAKTQASGFGGMLSIELRGNGQSARTFLENLKIIAIAESLGGYESLAELPSVMTHNSVPEHEREKLGINNCLVRISVGLEDVNDLIEDIEQALTCVN